MKTTRTIKSLVSQMEKCRVAIGKQRDILREIQGEVESLLDPTDRGVEALDDAIETLSEEF